MNDRIAFFKIYLRRVSTAMALWRCFECEQFAGEKIAHPILDVGSGDGFFAKTVFGIPVEAGIDLNPKEVERARRSGAYREVLLGDATAMPFARGRFKSAVSNCVLEHIPDIDGALKEIHRVLKPGGRLYITVPSEHFNRGMGLKLFLESVGLGSLGQAYLDGINRAFRHFHVDDAATWTRRLKKAGFKTEVCRYIIPLHAFRAYEPWMYPALISKLNWLVFGRWVLLPRGWLTVIMPKILRRVLEATGEPGACYYIRARKAR